MTEKASDPVVRQLLRLILEMLRQREEAKESGVAASQGMKPCLK